MLNYEVLAETPHWIAVNKPGGKNVEQLWDYPSVETDVKNYLRTDFDKDPFVGIVHRLDRPVSGVLLLAKRKMPLKLLNEQFAQRQVKKVYWAITENTPGSDKGVLEHYLLKDKKAKRAIAYTQQKNKAILAKLTYKVLRKKNGLCLLEIRPQSGKYHQIRVQLSSAGCPILGDRKYGSLIDIGSDIIALHAQQLSFNDPNTSAIKVINAAVPSCEIWNDIL